MFSLLNSLIYFSLTQSIVHATDDVNTSIQINASSSTLSRSSTPEYETLCLETGIPPVILCENDLHGCDDNSTALSTDEEESTGLCFSFGTDCRST